MLHAQPGHCNVHGGRNFSIRRHAASCDDFSAIIRLGGRPGATTNVQLQMALSGLLCAPERLARGRR